MAPPAGVAAPSVVGPGKRGGNGAGRRPALGLARQPRAAQTTHVTGGQLIKIHSRPQTTPLHIPDQNGSPGHITLNTGHGRPRAPERHRRLRST